MRTPYIVGNWKMNGLSVHLAELRNLVLGLRDQAVPVEVALAVPATLITRAAALVEGSSLALGGQTCHTENAGAHTGDISAAMLADAGASFTIVGHSERRTDHGETNAVVRDKALAALNVGLDCIICVGESLAIRESGDTEHFIHQQVRESVPFGQDLTRITIAYEPIWAIGTGKTADVADIVAVHQAIRRTYDMIGADPTTLRIQYGGSVNASNAAEILAADDVDGALVGGASLRADSFLQIIAAAQSKVQSTAL